MVFIWLLQLGLCCCFVVLGWKRCYILRDTLKVILVTRSVSW